MTQCGWPLEVPPFHPFLAKSEVQFRDSGKFLDTQDGCIAVDCPNIWKSVKAYDEMPIPLIWRARGTETQPYPGEFRFADLPDADPDQLKCLCQSIAVIIKEIRKLDAEGQFLWSNWCKDGENIPDIDPQDPNINSLFGLDVMTTQLYWRVDCITQTFCPCPTNGPFGAECPADEKAPFEIISGVLADGGVDLTAGEEATLHRLASGVDRASADPHRPTKEIPEINLRGARSEDVISLMNKVARAKRLRK